MNGRRFLECNSTYRNRIQYPNQASFVVPFGNSNSDPFNTTDIITEGPVLYVWKGGPGYTGTTGSYSGAGGYVSEGTFKTGSTDAYPLLSQRTGNPILPITLGTSSATTLAYYPNYYLGYGIANVNTNQTRLIMSYDPTTAGITDNIAFDGLTAGDRYVIYDPSQSSQSIIHLQTIDAIGIPIVSTVNAFTNFYIIDETLSLGNTICYRKIIAYDNTTQLATLESPFPSNWQSTDVYTMRQTLPTEVWSIQSASSAGNFQMVTLPTGASSVDDFYQNRFLYKIPLTGTGASTAITSNSVNDFYFIAGYTGASRTAVIKPMYSNYLSNALVPNNVVNIVNFKANSEQPLLYSGSLVSQQEDRNYEIAIVDIVFPNVNMSTGPRVVQYPYVYVSLESVSSSSGGMNNSIMYSNNPYSRRAMFMVTITDTTIPQITPFLKTDSGSSAVTMKFKPNDSLKFTMWLPDGSLYKTQLNDSLPPYPPNPLLQITCVFSLRQL